MKKYRLDFGYEEVILNVSDDHTMVIFDSNFDELLIKDSIDETIENCGCFDFDYFKEVIQDNVSLYV